ncbi:MAG: hypothetical protein PHY92_06230 [Alphaproteobacteria bacterium]|nr:hypothetical protein [Alphaproteobacteria bacterium]
MLNLSHFFIGPALAQTMSFADQTAGDPMSHMGKYLPVLILGTAVYFLFFHKKKKR